MNTTLFPGIHSCRLLIVLFTFSFSLHAQQVPLPHAYAHNDYWHQHPLYDALRNGFTYIEADVWVRNGHLLVAHKPPFWGKHPSLNALYLQPLASLFANNSAGNIDNVVLMIDIKSGPSKTYKLLKELLVSYQPILSGYKNGVVTIRQLTIILTGKRPLNRLREDTARWMFADADIEKIDTADTASGLYLTASGRYSNIVTWRGQHTIQQEEKDKLKSLVTKAHAAGQKVRLWASPENERVWMQLLDCGVDLINTDKLDALRKFLTAELSAL